MTESSHSLRLINAANASSLGRAAAAAAKGSLSFSSSAFNFKRRFSPDHHPLPSCRSTSKQTRPCQQHSTPRTTRTGKQTHPTPGQPWLGQQPGPPPPQCVQRLFSLRDAASSTAAAAEAKAWRRRRTPTNASDSRVSPAYTDSEPAEIDLCDARAAACVSDVACAAGKK